MNVFSRIKDRSDSDLYFILQIPGEWRSEVLNEAKKELRKREQGKSSTIQSSLQLSRKELVADIKKNARYPIYKLLFFMLISVFNIRSSGAFFGHAGELKDEGYFLLNKQFLVISFTGIFAWFIALFILFNFLIEL